MEEREALLRLCIQSLSLGEVEWSLHLTRRLRGLDANATRQLLSEIIAVNEPALEFRELKSHRFCRTVWRLVSQFLNSAVLQDRLLMLKGELSIIMDSIESSIDIENDVTVLKEGLHCICEKFDRRGSRRRSMDSSIASVITRLIKTHSTFLRSISDAFNRCRLEGAPKELQSFIQSLERSMLTAVEGALRGNRLQEALDIVQHLRSNVLPDGDYLKSMKLLAQQMEAHRSSIVSAVASTGSVSLLMSLQRETEAMVASDHSILPKDVLFVADRLGVGFQEASVRGWHVEGLRLDTVLKEISRGRFDLLERWRPENRRLLGLVTLMGWDALSAQNTASTFPLKAQLLDTAFPRLAPGIRSELSCAVSSLVAKLRFSEMLSKLTDGRLEAAEMLTRLRWETPQSVMSESVTQFDTGFIRALASVLSPLTVDVRSPIVGDLQLVCSAGTISAFVGCLMLLMDVFDGHNQIPDLELWCSEMSQLVTVIHDALHALHGSIIHVWLLSIINDILRLFLSKPEKFKGMHVTFQQNTKSKNSPSDILKVIRDLIEVLHRSMAEIETEGASWIQGFICAHVVNFDVFYTDLELALDFLMHSNSRQTWSFVSKGNWKEFGGYLCLPSAMHQMLANEASNFDIQIRDVFYWSDQFSRGVVHEVPSNGDVIPLALDAIVSQRVTVDVSCKILKMALHMTSDGVDVTSGSMICVASHLLECVGSLSRSETNIGELFGKGIARRGPFATTSNGPHVRKILEHLRAITRLKDALRDLHRGRLRYLSGLLHNLSKALSDDMSSFESCAILEVSGCGPDVSTSQTTPEGTSNVSYLSSMVHYLAEVGDIVSTMDDGPSEGHNYFAMLHQSPQELLTSLIQNAQCAQDVDHAVAAAEVLGVDVTHEVLTTWLHPLYPPHDHPDIEYARASDRIQRMPSLEALKEFVNVSPPRGMIACAFANLQKLNERDDVTDVTEVTARHVMGGRTAERVMDALSVVFASKEESQFPTLQNWVNRCLSASTREPPADLHSIRRQSMEQLKTEGHLRLAFKSLDRIYKGQLPDDILMAFIEASGRFPEEDEPDGFYFVNDDGDADPLKSVPISWVACLRLTDSHVAMTAAEDRVHSWSLERAIEFFSLKSEHPSSNPWLKKLKLYQTILQSPLSGEFHDWTAIDALHSGDPCQLVRKLLTADLTEAALRVVQSRSVVHSLRRDVHAAHIQWLDQCGISKGGGPVASIRFMAQLSPVEAFEAGMAVLTSNCSLTLCRALVQYLMSVKHALSTDCVDQLERTKLGVAALRCLPRQWAEKCAKLVEMPSLIVESLIMAQQISLIKKLFKEVPSLRDDNLLIYYARKALGLGADVMALPSFMRVTLESPVTGKRTDKTPVTLQSRLSFHLVSHVSDLEPGVGLVPMTVLSGNPAFDEQLRADHDFRGMPNLTCFRVLLDLLPTAASASAASRTAADLANARLTQIIPELEWNAVVAQDVSQGVDVCLEVLDYADRTHASIDPSSSNGSPNAQLRQEVELLQKLLTAGIQASLADLRHTHRCEGLLRRLVTAEQYHLSVQTALQCHIDERPYWEAWVIASIQEGNFISARERVPYIFRLPIGSQMDSPRIRMESRQAAVRLVRVLEMTCPPDLPSFFALHNSLKQSRFSNVLRASAKEIMKFVKGPTDDFDREMSFEALGFNDRMKRKDMVTHAASSTMSSERLTLCEELLATYAPALLMSFMFRHGRGDVAAQVMYPENLEDDRRIRRERSWSRDPSSESSDVLQTVRSTPLQTIYRSKSLTRETAEITISRRHTGSWEAGRQLLASTSKPLSELTPLTVGPSNTDALIHGVHPHELAREIENVHQICDLSVRYTTIEAMVAAMLAGGPRGKRALSEACTWLETAGHYRHLYRCQKALHRIDAAGETCIRLSWTSMDAADAVGYLKSAKDHFHEALSAVQQRRENVVVVRTQAELTTLVARVTLQLLIYEELLLKGHPPGKTHCDAINK